MSKTVLITGISGFLGSAVAQELVTCGYQVIATTRQNSILWRCQAFLEQLVLVNLDQGDWKLRIMEFKPSIFIHCAWEGVWNDRDNWQTQLKNIDLAINLLELSKTVGAEKFIGFGSQAEYGLFSGMIDENHQINPTSAYGLSKNLVAQTVKCYCDQHNINWYWLRLFSFFGEKEDDQWFIPMMIKNVFYQQPIDMTPGFQRYGYMYVRDLAQIIIRIIKSPIKSDIYNLSSKKSIGLRELVEKLVNIIQPKSSQINFGAIPYRENQPMLVQGKITKLENELGEILESDFDRNLQNVVNYKLDQLKKL